MERDVPTVLTNRDVKAGSFGFTAEDGGSGLALDIGEWESCLSKALVRGTEKLLDRESGHHNTSSWSKGLTKPFL